MGRKTDAALFSTANIRMDAGEGRYSASRAPVPPDDVPLFRRQRRAFHAMLNDVLFSGASAAADRDDLTLDPLLNGRSIADPLAAAAAAHHQRQAWAEPVAGTCRSRVSTASGISKPERAPVQQAAFTSRSRSYPQHQAAYQYRQAAEPQQPVLPARSRPYPQHQAYQPEQAPVQQPVYQPEPSCHAASGAASLRQA